jgi:hypothetical protein
MRGGFKRNTRWGLLLTPKRVSFLSTFDLTPFWRLKSMWKVFSEHEIYDFV